MSWSNHKEFAHDWIESWNAHDLDRIMSHYADNVTLTSGKVQQVLGQEGGAVRGKANLRAYFEKRLAMPPKVHFERVAATFTPMHSYHARIYYALELMGKVEAFHAKVFAAIQPHCETLSSQ